MTSLSRFVQDSVIVGLSKLSVLDPLSSRKPKSSHNFVILTRDSKRAGLRCPAQRTTKLLRLVSHHSPTHCHVFRDSCNTNRGHQDTEGRSPPPNSRPNRVLKHSQMSWSCSLANAWKKSGGPLSRSSSHEGWHKRVVTTTQTAGPESQEYAQTRLGGMLPLIATGPRPMPQGSANHADSTLSEIIQIKLQHEKERGIASIHRPQTGARSTWPLGI